MQIKRYVGTSQQKIFSRIRKDLGPDAKILHTSFVRPKGPLRFLARPRVEIVVGTGFQLVKEYSTKPARTTEPANVVRSGGKTASPAPAPVAVPDSLQKDVNELKRMVADQSELMRQEKLGEVPDDLGEEYLALTSHEVSQRLARQLIRRIQKSLPAEGRNPTAVRGAVRAAMRELIRCGDGITLRPGRCVRVAFVGPTGVGKTTTIAKLMSVYSYRGKSVGVIANDTFRIAAADQIRRVAELVGVPIRICRTKEEIARAVDEFSDRDLVLVDTAGRGQKDQKRIQELDEVLEAAKVDETHLVLSVTTGRSTMMHVIENFLPCGVNRIILTKLDEAVKAGLILDVLAKVEQGLSFITTGQEIPNDIEIADPDRLVSLIFGEEAVA